MAFHRRVIRTQDQYDRLRWYQAFKELKKSRSGFFEARFSLFDFANRAGLRDDLEWRRHCRCLYLFSQSEEGRLLKWGYFSKFYQAIRPLTQIISGHITLKAQSIRAVLFLVLICHDLVRVQCFPKQWKMIVVSMIHKRGKPQDFSE